MPGLAHVERDRGTAPHLDRLGVHGHRFPAAVELGGGPLVVQALDVQVLDVAAHVGHAPRVVRRRPDQDPGHERQRHAAGLEPGRSKMELEPRRRLLHEQVRVVGQERPSARGPGTRHDPVVRTLAARTREPVQQPPGERSRGDPGRVGRGRQERPRGLGAEPFGQPQPEQLVVPVARQPPREVRERGRPGLEVLGEVGGGAEHRVLEGRRRHGVHPRPGAVDEPPHHRPRRIAPALRLVDADPVEADRPREPVGRDREIGEPPREASARRAQRELDLEQPLRGLDEPLREPQVVQSTPPTGRGSPTGRAAPRRVRGARDLELALDRGQGGAGGAQELLERVGHGAGAYRLPPGPRPGRLSPSSPVLE